MARLLRRAWSDYLPVLVVALATTVLLVGSLGLAFYAGGQAVLQPCLVSKLEQVMSFQDSLVRISLDARLK